MQINHPKTYSRSPRLRLRFTPNQHSVAGHARSGSPVLHSSKSDAGRGAGIIFLLLFSSLDLLAQVNTKNPNAGVAGANTAVIHSANHTNSINTTALNIFSSKAVKNRQPKLALQVEIADTVAKQAYGLSYRKFLPEKQGMLFIFATSQMGSFWGKNTLIPLDLIYIDQNRKITQISQIKPHDLNPVPSQDKIRYALELNQGTAEKYGLQVGDQLVWN